MQKYKDVICSLPTPPLPVWIGGGVSSYNARSALIANAAIRSWTVLQRNRLFPTIRNQEIHYNPTTQQPRSWNEAGQNKAVF